MKKGIKEVANPLIWRYQRQIKEALDPNDCGAGGYYFLDEESIQEALATLEKRKQGRK